MNKINIRLIVGLGNPGSQYENTRHNVGFFFIDELAKCFETPDFTLKKNLRSEISEVRIPNSGFKVILAKPQTFVNESGAAVLALSKFYKIKPENILAVHDDIDILWGNFKFSFSRRSAGHNGVESIIKSLKTKNFWRLRIGIQASLKKHIPADKIILKKFSPAELKFLKLTVNRAISDLENSLF